jgi:hypothetical protein
MNITNKGDIHGCNSISTFGFRNHIRPAHHDYGSIIINGNGLLGNVRTVMGTGSESGNLCHIRLSFSKNQFEDK